ncbi:MAG TPA: protein tyrosine phosphatase family protein [Vicinamibacterales bacterium]|jgi:uncharacterized protein (TIGR01244 family)|nr:protein tyrosine phosphatase family protein [Vicinamibacterales bacterium]
MKTTIAAFVAVLFVAGVSAQVKKDTLPGGTNYTHVETTVACAGAITPDSVAGIKNLGYKSVINLREASEAGANIDAEEAAAKTAGINFVHIPMNSANPSPSVVEPFLKAVTDPANTPAFIHCASGNRASALWAIKRVKVDHWDTDKALAEAADLGLTHDALKQWVRDQIASH